MNRLAVLGQPIAHSLSPAMHGAAFAALGIGQDWSYVAIEINPGDFSDGVRRLASEGFAGVNVTIPHKEAALAVAGDASAAAREIGASNTLSFGSGAIRADNTDAAGLIAALPADPAGMRALVLGAGGSARAVAWALKRARADVIVHNRTHSRALELAADIGVNSIESAGEIRLSDYDILVNATSIGLRMPAEQSVTPDSPLKALGLGVDGLDDRKVVVDLVYGAEPTDLIETARRHGAKTVDGREILVRQGAESLRIWTGLEPPLEAMREAIQSR